MSKPYDWLKLSKHHHMSREEMPKLRINKREVRTTPLIRTPYLHPRCIYTLYKKYWYLMIKIFMPYITRIKNSERYSLLIQQSIWFEFSYDYLEKK